MKKLICLLLPILLLVSCGTIKNAQTDFNLYYYEVGNRDAIVTYPATLPDGTREQEVRLLYSQLTEAPENTLSPIILSDITLINISFDDRTCILRLSENYLDEDYVSRTAMNACLTKTLCQLSYIDAITIECGSNTETYNGESFVTETPRTLYDTHTVNLYFANQNFDGLIPELRIFSLEADASLELAVMELLTSGPTKIGMQKAIPDNTQINSVYVNDGVCQIDLSPEFVENAQHDKVSETVIVYSIVNTITELPMINSVKILIDGNPGYGYSHCKISTPLTYRSDIFGR